MGTEKKEEKRIARRGFLKGAAVGAAGLAAGALAGCGPGSNAGVVKETVEVPVEVVKEVEVTKSDVPDQWDYEADVVVIGAGGSGLVAAIRASDAGASVIVTEQNFDCGGRAINSGGATPLGGGNRLQKKYGVEDTPELHFQDMIDWSVLTTTGIADYRYNDPALMRVACDLQPAIFEWFEANGVTYVDQAPFAQGSGWGVSVMRNNQPTDELCKTDPNYSPAYAGGAAYTRPLERSARAKGVQFILNRHADKLIREGQFEGRVLGISASYTPRIPPGTDTRLESYYSDGNIDERRETITIRAKKAVILATSGYSGNVELRRVYDWRLTEEIQCSNQPWDGPGRSQDGIMLISAIDHGASLWAVTQPYEHGGQLRKRPIIGCQHTYTSFPPESPVFPWARATGITASKSAWHDAIAVNQAGKRFYDETGPGYCYPRSGPGSLGVAVPDPYVHGSWRNTEIQGVFKATAYTDASRAVNEGSTFPDYTPGPTWLIFDQALVDREGWQTGEPYTDPKFFFQADTLAELAAKLSDNPYQKAPMPPANLEATVARYNALVDAGNDEDFAKANLEFKIETPPFYAAWCTVVKHDSYGCLRTNTDMQVIDRSNNVIAGLYACGEIVGGWAEHGLGKCATEGYIAGDHAAKQTV